MRGIKKLLWTLFAVAMVIAGIYFFVFGEKLEEHIPDTNGPEDYSIAMISDEEIEAGNRLSKGGLTTTTKKTLLGLGDPVTIYSCKEFSGVYMLYMTDLLFGDFSFDIYDFEVTAGNFAIYILCNDQIVDVVKPGESSVRYVLENSQSGTYEVLLVGESASFTFTARADEFE